MMATMMMTMMTGVMMMIGKVHHSIQIIKPQSCWGFLFHEHLNCMLNMLDLPILSFPRR